MNQLEDFESPEHERERLLPEHIHPKVTQEIKPQGKALTLPSTGADLVTGGNI